MEDYPDGTNPYKLLEIWRDWVIDYTRLKDGEGNYMHYKHPGTLADQPIFDMQVFDCIRMQWIAERIKDRG